MALKMTVSFGLVTIPVRIEPAARGIRAGFNQLHKECHSRINQKKVCSCCTDKAGNPTVLGTAEIVKGFEIEKDQYIVITEEDLKPLEPESTKVMEITAAVDASEVDPILFDASYYLEPEPAGKRGFALLVAALEKKKKVAVATVTMYGSEQVVIIRVYRGKLMFHTMFYQDEVRSAPMVDEVPVKDAELDLACQLLEASAEQFDHAKYKDNYRLSVLEMIEAKKNKVPVSITKGTKKVAAPPDILDALKASIKQKKSA